MEGKAIQSDLYSMKLQIRQVNADLCLRRSEKSESGLLSPSLSLALIKLSKRPCAKSPHRHPDVQGEEPPPQERKADLGSPARWLSLRMAQH